MSHIINKILGREDESASHTHTSQGKTETNTAATSGGNTNVQRSSTSDGQTVEGHTVQKDGVHIRSSVSSDATSTVSMANQQKLNELVSKLGTTHSQIDEYARQQTEKIDAQIQGEIDQVVVRTRNEQEGLLQKATEHTAQIDSEYRAQLQKMVEEVDAAKAKRIADIEKELNNQQAGILKNARSEIDKLNQKASSMKISALKQAQAKASANADEISAEAAHLGQASTIHESTGTTTIRTEVSGEAKTKDAGVSSTRASTHSASGAQTTAESKTIETSQRQSQDRKH